MILFIEERGQKIHGYSEIRFKKTVWLIHNFMSYKRAL